MALTFNAINRAASFNPTSAFPLDARSYFESYELAVAAAATAAEPGTAEASNTVYYFGQTFVVNEANKATLYIVQPDQTLKEVGSVPVGDNQSISVVDGKIQLKGFGVGYYKYNEEVEGHYEFVEGEFIPGLQPQVVAAKEGTGFEIAWYEPNPTTVEGLETQISSLSGSVTTLTEKVDGHVESIEDLQSRVETLEADPATKTWVGQQGYLKAENLENYYTKEEADAAFMTETEVENKVNQIVSDAVDGDTYTSLTQIVQYINEHGGEATEMATAITNLENNKADKSELADYAKVSRVETLETNLAENYSTTEVINETLNGYQTKITADNKLSYALIEGTPEIPSTDGLAEIDYVDQEVKKVSDIVAGHTTAIEDLQDQKVTATQVNDLIANASIKAEKIDGVVANASNATQVGSPINFNISDTDTVSYDGSQEVTINVVEIAKTVVNAEKVAINNRIDEVAGDLSDLSQTVSRIDLAVKDLEGAQANVIEEIQLAGVKLEPVNKVVNINKISTDMLEQGSKILFLDGGNASDFNLED